MHFVAFFIFHMEKTRMQVKNDLRCLRQIRLCVYCSLREIGAGKSIDKDQEKVTKYYFKNLVVLISVKSLHLDLANVTRY